MKHFGSLIALGLFLACPVAADDKPSLKDHAVKLQGRHAYGVYIQGQKLGWMVLDVKLGKHEGKEVLISTEEMQAEMKRGGLTVRMELKDSSIYSLTGDGDLLVQEDHRKEGKAVTVWRGVRRGDRFVIGVSTAPGSDRSVAPPKKNLKATRDLDNWLRSGPKKDAVFNSWSITLEEADINVKEEHVYKSKKALTIGGVNTDVHHVLIKSKGAVSDVEMRTDGTPLKSSVGGFDIRAEPEAIAKKVGAVMVDLLDLASIPSDRDIGDPDKVEALTLSVTGLGDYALPTSHRQSLRPGEVSSTATVVLQRDFKPEKAEALSEAQRKAMLAATPRIQSDEAKVKQLSTKIVGEVNEVHRKAELLSKWVYRKVRKSFSDNPNTTLEALDRMAGDCKHHALLFVSLARAAGIPAREVGGVGYCGPGTKSFGWHAWAEFHDGHQWVSIDPTWDQARVDATHVKFSDSAEDMAWVNVLGKVKFKVVEVKRK